MRTRSQLTARRLRNATCIACAGLSLLVTAIVLRPSDVAATPPLAAPTPAAARSTISTSAAATAAMSAESSASAASAAGDSAQPAPTRGSAPAPAERPSAEPSEAATATVVFATTPATMAIVTWGKKRLGQIKPGKPLVVVRPRDSGPLDVVIRAPGYLPVQTRAHTFADNRVLVRLTPPERQHELLGYRAPLDAGVETPEQAAALNAIDAADGGVAPPGATAAATAPAEPAGPQTPVSVPGSIQ